MTLEQLRIFVAVAERQHVTKAAAALHLTQSAVSAAVTALEARHGVALFDRVGRGVVLNQTGQIFLEEARAVLARAAAAEAALEDLAGLRRGRLSIQASQTIASYWLPARLGAFREAYPGVILEVAIGNTSQAIEAVATGAAEIGLIEGEVSDPHLSSTVIDHDQMILVVAPEHPWSRGLKDGWALTDTAWVLREPGSGTRWALEAALARQGLRLGDIDVAMVLPGNEAVRAAVEAGVGAAIMSRSVAESGLASGALVKAPLELPRRPFRLLRHKERYQSKAGDAFIDCLERFAGRQETAGARALEQDPVRRNRLTG
jgi:DNA-binding transcriptional LysR family regulator